MLADPAATYWTSLLPGMPVIALGMALAVAPLTTAVLSSVDDRHTGTASGFNSAVARTGGLIATALAGAVISITGTGLIEAFHVAAIVAAVLAVAAGWPRGSPSKAENPLEYSASSWHFPLDITNHIGYVPCRFLTEAPRNREAARPAGSPPFAAGAQCAGDGLSPRPDPPAAGSREAGLPARGQRKPRPG